MESSKSPQKLSSIADTLDSLVLRVGRTLAWANLLLIGVILTQVVLRYGFHHGLAPLEELMWHLYALAAMVGKSAAMFIKGYSKRHLRPSPRLVTVARPRPLNGRRGVPPPLAGVAAVSAPEQIEQPLAAGVETEKE